MATIIPESEHLQKAIKWISSNKENNPSLNKLIEEAILRFDLSPKESEFLVTFFKNSKKTS